MNDSEPTSFLASSNVSISVSNNCFQINEWLQFPKTPPGACGGYGELEGESVLNIQDESLYLHTPSLVSTPRHQESELCLTQAMCAMEQSLLSQTEVDDTECPYLFATWDEYYLIIRYLSCDGNKAPKKAFAFDVEMYLNNFLASSHALRLSLCTVAADVYLSQEATATYFQQARRALLLEFSSEPTVECVLACSLLFQLAVKNGDIVSGIKYLQWGRIILCSLQLEIDPNDLQFVQCLNERQSEERRRVFWEFYHSYLLASSLDDGDVLDIPNFTQVNSPQQVLDGSNTIFRHKPVLYFECLILRLISTSKRRYATPPSSILDSCTNLQLSLNALRARIPPSLLITSKFPESMTAEEESFCMLQVSVAQDALPKFNILLHAATSIIFRPTLFLATKIEYPPHVKRAIATAATECIRSGLQIVTIASFSLYISSTTTPETRDLFSMEGSQFALFEAIAVFWFVYTKMDPRWWSLITCRINDFSMLRKRLHEVVNFVVKVGAKEGKGGNTRLVARRMALMVHEIEGSRKRVKVEKKGGADINVVEDNDRRKRVGGATTPFVFLSLLGMELRNGNRWDGRGEDGWREAWKHERFTF